MPVADHVLTALRHGSLPAARLVAREYRDGHHMRALADGDEWGTSGLAEDAAEALAQTRDPRERVELTALKEWNPPAIYVYWTLHGHVFQGSDDVQECLHCGASYELVHDEPDNPSHGRYRTWNGDDPIECTATSHEENRNCNCRTCTG